MKAARMEKHVVLITFVAFICSLNIYILIGVKPFDLLISKDYGFTEVYIKPARKKCAPREGVIVLNTLGRLGNNLFEIAFMKRLAYELCWEDQVLFRTLWNAEYPNKEGNNNRAAECFPNAGLAQNHKLFPNTISAPLQDELGFNQSSWGGLTHTHSREYKSLLASAVENRKAINVEHVISKALYTGNGTDQLVETIRNNDTNITLLHLEAFFVNTDWMKGWEHKIFKKWLAFNPNCCFHQPPDNAVVFHVRDFSEKDHTFESGNITPHAYMQIMEHYDLTNRPLWIVCQPTSVESEYVKSIISMSKVKPRILTGEDQYDALCILSRAKTLLLSSASTFSQMGALLAGPAADVHYPMRVLEKPGTTISVPHFKYHLVDAQNRNTTKVSRFDVPHEEIEFVSG